MVGTRVVVVGALEARVLGGGSSTDRLGEWQREIIDVAAIEIGGLVLDGDGIPHVAYTSETQDGHDYTMVIATRTCP